MTKKEQVTKYVKYIFNLYDANKQDFFFVCDEETWEHIEIPLFPRRRIDNETLERISVHLGLTKEEILNMDKQAAKRYWNKYPFFRLYKEFMRNWAWQSRYKSELPTTEELLLTAIFTEEDELPFEERYDYPAVKERMIQKLKEIDVVIPGTYHEHADITELRISTEVFVSFPQCKEMLQSFMDIVNRIKELFFKALRTDLNEIEANELNFLASWMHMYDVVAQSTLLTYNNILIYRDVFVKENYKDFFYYANFRRFIGTAPWRCKEFFDDMSLVQEFVNIYPQAKAGMHQFTMNVTKFSCDFAWSDAKPIVYSPEEEDVPVEQRAKERTHIYVEKTPEEMFGWEEYAKKLKDAASPPAKGGLKIPIRKNNMMLAPEETLERMYARVDAKLKG